MDYRIVIKKTKGGETVKTLILNSDYTPFDIVSYRKGIVLHYCENTVYCVDFYDKYITDSKGRKYQIPAVLVLRKHVNIGGKKAPYNKLNVYARDMFRCQYCHTKCNKENITIDHVIPRSKWKSSTGPTNFENVVTCCKSCNSIKGDKTLTECGFTLSRRPRSMNRFQAFKNKLICLDTPVQWKPYVK